LPTPPGGERIARSEEVRDHQDHKEQDMAGEVFISYRRADQRWAKRLSELLRAEGVEAWYDAQVGAGHDWRAETGAALESSQIFVLLFSRAAAESTDIAKELAAATLGGKRVVPVRLEDVRPTGAFLYELASRNWIDAYQDTDARLADLAKSLASELRLGSNAESPTGLHQRAHVPSLARRRTPVAIATGAVLIAAVAGAGAMWWHSRSSVPVNTASRVAVLPFDALSEGAAARNVTDGLTDQIVTALSNTRIQVVSREDAKTLRGENRERKARDLGVTLIFDGTVRDDGRTVTIRVHADDPVHHALVWSAEAEGAAQNSDRLQAQMSRRIVQALACSNRAIGTAHGLSDPALLSRYLHACDIFVNANYTPELVFELLGSLREICAKAPDFVPAHSDLAKFAVYFLPLLPPDQGPPLRKEAESEARKALALDPKTPDAYLALEFLQPITAWAERERLLRLGVATDPAWPHTNGFLGLLLLDMGRVDEGLVFMQKAASADLQIDWGPANAVQQARTSDAERSIRYLRQELAVRTNTREIWNFLFSGLQIATRWTEARDLLHGLSVADPSVTRQPSYQANDTFLTAMVSPTPANKDKARRVALAAPGGANNLTSIAISHLAFLGFMDDAFSVARTYEVGGPESGASPGTIYAPAMTRDPRFMKAADWFKLVDYWRASNKWPDFCTAPDLPYDCKAEAEKVVAHRTG
jgi:TolB-like protein